MTILSQMLHATDIEDFPKVSMQDINYNININLQYKISSSMIIAQNKWRVRLTQLINKVILLTFTTRFL